MNKKGIFFTLITLIIITLLLVSYTFFSVFKERKTIQKRIDTLNSFVFSIEEDLSRKLFTAGFRTILVFEEKIIETGVPISNTDSLFEELFFNGTYQNINEQIMFGTTFPDIINDFNTKASKLNLVINLTNPTAKLTQVDPWNLKIILNAELSVQDIKNLASWNKTENFSSTIALSYFDDPTYLLNSGGIITHKIIKTSYTNFSAQNILDHTLNSYYINSTQAPSFLDRIKGNLQSQSPHGIESLVNIQQLINQGITVQDKSIVDHIYFSSSNPPSCNILGLPIWFKLDTPAQAQYNVSC